MVAAARRRTRPAPPRRLSLSARSPTANYKIFAWLIELCKLVVRALSDPMSHTPLIILFCIVAVALRGTQELPTATALHIAGAGVVLCLVVEATIRCLMRCPIESDFALGYSNTRSVKVSNKSRIRRQPNHSLRAIDKQRKLARRPARRPVVRRRRQKRPLRDRKTRHKQLSWPILILLVFTYPMAERVRIELYRAVLHWAFAAFRQKKPTQSTSRIFSLNWGALPTEKNAVVRRLILANAPLYEDCKVRDSSLIVARALYKAFRNEMLCRSDERKHALYILQNYFDSGQFSKYGRAIKNEMLRCSLEICLMMIQRHEEKEPMTDGEIDQVVDNMKDLPYHKNDSFTYESTAAIVEHPYALPFLLELMSAHEQQHFRRIRPLPNLIWEIFNGCERRRPNRITAIIRYHPLLANAFSCMGFSHIASLMRAGHLSCAHFMTPHLLGRVATMIAQPFSPLPYLPPAHEVTFRLLEAALPDAASLQDLLGHGLLKVARNISHLDDLSHRYATAHVTFNSTLRLHPEWRAQFQRWTQDGALANPTAILGRQFALRRSPSANYELL